MPIDLLSLLCQWGKLRGKRGQLSGGRENALFATASLQVRNKEIKRNTESLLYQKVGRGIWSLWNTFFLLMEIVQKIIILPNSLLIMSFCFNHFFSSLIFLAASADCNVCGHIFRFHFGQIKLLAVTFLTLFLFFKFSPRPSKWNKHRHAAGLG